jgi:hypothetical protein
MYFSSPASSGANPADHRARHAARRICARKNRNTTRNWTSQHHHHRAGWSSKNLRKDGNAFCLICDEQRERMASVIAQQPRVRDESL